MTTTTKRHIGKCPGCKRTYSVMAAFVECVGGGAFPGYERRLTRGGNQVDSVLVRDDGYVMAGCANGRSPVIECDCTVASHGIGLLVEMKRVHGIFKPDHKCDARCLAGKGLVCECACGGRNHGAAHGA